MILVDKRGENSIVVAPGANAKLSPKDVDAAEALIASASVVVLQLEVPLETVRHAAAMCRRLGVFTILDPAPVPPAALPDDLYAVDLLTPNEAEAAALLDPGGATGGALPPEETAERLLTRGPRAVL